MAANGRPWVAAIDIGGTFTDVVAIEPGAGRTASAKVLTTPDDPIRGFFDALEALPARGGPAIDGIGTLVHATTLATNTLIERTGAHTALLTTAGFRDILEMASEDRYDLYDLDIEPVLPLVPREHRLEVVERLTARGEVERPVDAASVEAAIDHVREAGIEAVAVGFLHAYADGRHERAVADAVAAALPGAFVTTSSGVAPIAREYQRLVATTINAYVGPRLATYLGVVEARLRERGFDGLVRIMRSDGGMFSVAEARRQPARLLESSPAGGVVAVASVARAAGEPVCVAFDMGGTTAKASLVLDGTPAITEELEVARLERLQPGSGLPLRLASVDLIEIGAGGGSIAGPGPLGLLAVGPASAGADPGPAAYGRGGTRATVTDADLLLGYLDPDRFAAGRIRLDVEAAAAAVRRDVVQPLGLDGVPAGAWAVHDLVNEKMAQAISLHCVEHGIDPTSVTLVATGGAGPVHAANLLAKIGCARLVCVAGAGVASAAGVLQADRTLDRTTTQIVPLDVLAEGEVMARLDALEAALRADVAEDLSALRRHAYVHLRLSGQAYEVRVEVDAGGATAAGLVARFAVEYERRFGRPPAPGPVEAVNWEVRLVGAQPWTRAQAAPAAAAPGAGPPAPGRREAWFGRGGSVPADVWPREALVPGHEVRGPALIEDAFTTVVVAPAQRARADAAGHVHVERDRG